MKMSIILSELLKVYLISFYIPPHYFMKQYILHVKFLEYFKIQTNQNTKSLSYPLCHYDRTPLTASLLNKRDWCPQWGHLASAGSLSCLLPWRKEERQTEGMDTVACHDRKAEESKPIPTSPFDSSINLLELKGIPLPFGSVPHDCPTKIWCGPLCAGCWEQNPG